MVADWLFTACGGTGKGIAFKELLCGLVLLTKGTQEEKIRFLWTLYCNDSGTHILRQDFLKAIQVETTYQSNAISSTAINATSSGSNNQALVNNKSNSLSRYTVALFGQNDRVSFEQFKSWIQIYKGATVLSKWLLQDTSVSLSSELETPTFYQSLAGVTHLEEQDIGDLEKVFWLLKGLAVTGQLDVESLGPLICPPIPKAALGGVFLAFDENHDGHIDFKELCCGVSAACRGPNVERSKFCFKVFDIDRDGVLNFGEVGKMVDILLFVAKETNAGCYRNITSKQVMDELYRRSTDITYGSGGTKMQQVPDPLPEFKFTQEDFLIWSIESTSNLVQPFLDLLFEVCHIVLGLRPQCKHLEGDIVRGWLAREVRRGYKVGQFWYLISADWWQHFTQYTQPAMNSSCVHCKIASSYANSRQNASATIAGVDEAVICDESFNSNSTESMGDLLNTGGDSSSLGSGSSGISCGRHPGSPPGLIDNSTLIAPVLYKPMQVPTLTGEGGRLKRDLTLVQHRDFELVPDSLWKALAQWYGGPLPLPRQVIQPLSTADVELELYPLNLRILRHQNPTAQQQQQTNSAWGNISGGYGVLTGGNYSNVSVSNMLQPPKKYLAYTAAFSRLATVKQVAEFLCQRLKLRVEDIRLWHLVPTASSVAEFPYLLEEDNLSLQDLSIADNDQLLLEIRNKDLTWPEELGSLALSHPGSTHSNQERRGTVASTHSLHPPGATGLHNLGNTCFINAALQVLFNTQPLTQYFIRSMHLYELNTGNKLGTKGQLAIRYAELLREVWTASQRSIAPIKLRFCITKNAPQFSGGGQHDSQELLDWLLDSLHEDLNRVMEKPYSELKDSDGRSDVVVAMEAWNQHHARNQSIIVDLFYGQLKSKVTCSGCGRDSVRFDPFSLLSLPLPLENYTYCEVLVTLLDGSVPIKYGLRLNSELKYWDLKKQLSDLCQLDPELMLICELSNSQIRCILPNDQKVKPSTAAELYVYELPQSDNVLVRSRAGSELAINIEKGLKDIQRTPALLLPPLEPNQLTTSSVSTTISSSSSSSTTVDDTVAIAGRYRSSGEAAGAANGTNGSGGAGANSHRRTDSSGTTTASKVSRCFGNTLCMPPNMLCFKNIPEISASPDSTFIFSEGTHHPYGVSNPYATANTTTSTTHNFKDHNRPKATASANLTNHTGDGSVGDGWHLSAGGGGTTMCNGIGDFEHGTAAGAESDIIYNGHLSDGEAESFPYADSFHGHHSGDAFNLSAIRRPPSATSGTNHFSRNCPNNSGVNNSYLIAVHRKLSRQDTYFLSHHKSRPGLFGVPLLIPCYEGVTNKQLYCSVWVQVARLLSPLPPTPPDQSNHATDCDDSLGYDFPFTLRAVASGGRVCALCPWSRFCRGCEIPCTDELLLQGLVASGLPSSNSSTPNLSSREHTPTFRRKVYGSSTTSSLDGNQSSPSPSLRTINNSNIQIAIDWDPTALHLRYQSTRERLWTEHETVAICRRQQTEPVDLDHCLRAFTSEEKLEQWYHCSHCKQKKPATKKLQIWKLPPILIVHLKRFNYVNNKWVKSQKVVNFPYEDFDPTPYLASVPQETILRHKELLDGGGSASAHDVRNHDCHDEIVEFDREMSMIDEVSDEVSLSSITGTIEAGRVEKVVQPNTADQHTSESATVSEPSKSITPAIAGTHPVACARQEVSTADDSPEKGKNRSSVKLKGQRKRLVSSSLTKTPVIDGEFIDFHQHNLKAERDPFDLKYQLYAAVCHSGMLNGGHYVSYAANPNGSWYCYNDSSCREIPTRPKIDPSTAYLLFYERRDLDYEPYLPKVDRKQISPEHLAELEESDNELKKMCTLM
ncbi:ubiquitin carboxyl-terminal hydrolase 32 [Uranotaenia lowii]|uniref:ubiquitin carboxyl-terminal hydrolase 32 n=1 Tax=Uranotaenia lowii TaxID=190385 RepID=UPI002479A5A9|nr:ubiquitin carboxyl-terminal hydrolase 32 [Uranotaenia lowii]